VKPRTDFGRTLTRTDFGGHVTTLTYDLAGRLSAQTSTAGQSLTYAYYTTGLISSISDTAKSGLTTYTYDAEGRRLSEKYVLGGVTYQDARATYNSRGWKVSYSDTGENGQQPAWADYSYTRSGDVRRIQNHARKLILSAPGESTQWDSDDWFDYDAMERMVVSDGALDAVSGVVGGINGLKGTLIEYDAAGQRARTTSLSTNPGITGSVAEDYVYREDGYLMGVNIDGAAAPMMTATC